MIRKIIYINSVLIVLLATSFFVYPPIRAVLDLQDPALQQPGIPKSAWRLYKNLTPRYASWAQARVEEGRAETLSTTDISGTEWPLFGSLFYLWGIENLQSAWNAGDHAAGEEPKVFAREAIIAASELVIDPKHAAWVKKHWGDEYLHRENVFYRMLVIGSLTARENLLHDGAHLELLRDQVETFSKELDASKTGLLDDYPGECYPGDVMAALMCIKRADKVLGTNHSKFLTRALRGFTGQRATKHGLPPYFASSVTGLPVSTARGCANSYVCLTAPELWPAQAQEWYGLYDRFFWQERLSGEGFREYPNNVPKSDWTMDVDAGPVIAGYGAAANAFGVGAARKNGRFDRAYPLAAELFATIGELPNGVLAAPRLLSNASDAPLLGEASILWLLSIQPEKGFPIKTGGSIPYFVYIVLVTVFLFGLWRIVVALEALRAAWVETEQDVWTPRFQGVLWVCMMLGVIAALAKGHELIGLIVLVVAVMLPVVKKKKAPTGTEGWSEEPTNPLSKTPAVEGGDSSRAS